MIKTWKWFHKTFIALFKFTYAININILALRFLKAMYGFGFNCQHYSSASVIMLCLCNVSVGQCRQLKERVLVVDRNIHCTLCACVYWSVSIKLRLHEFCCLSQRVEVCWCRHLKTLSTLPCLKDYRISSDLPIGIYIC